MKVQVKLDEYNIKKIDIKISTALHQTGDALLTDILSAQVIPYDQSTMQNDQTFVDASNIDKGVVAIISNTPYARKLYYHPEYNFQTVNNPNAQGRWFDEWVVGNKKELSYKYFVEMMKRLGGVL